MERVGERVTIGKGTEGSPVVRIAPYQDPWKQRALIVWIILFGFCGLFVASRFFIDVPAKEKIVYLVFLVFWGYFEYMTVRTALWRQYGQESLWLEDGNLVLEHAIGGRKNRSRYPLPDDAQVRLVERDEKAFSTHFDAAYYVVGLMRLEIDCGEKMLRFGEKLSDPDARNLKKELDQIFLPSRG